MGPHRHLVLVGEGLCARAFEGAIVHQDQDARFRRLGSLWFDGQERRAVDLYPVEASPLRQGASLKTLTHPALLVVDEIGYLPVTQSGAVLFFQLINRRYGHASTVLTSNKGFEEWGRILGDEGDGRRPSGPAPAPVPHHQHPGQQLPDAPPRRALQGVPSIGDSNKPRILCRHRAVGRGGPKRKGWCVRRVFVPPLH